MENSLRLSKQNKFKEIIVCLYDTMDFIINVLDLDMWKNVMNKTLIQCCQTSSKQLEINQKHLPD